MSLTGCPFGCAQGTGKTSTILAVARKLNGARANNMVLEVRVAGRGTRCDERLTIRMYTVAERIG